MPAPEIVSAVATGLLAFMSIISGVYQFHSLRKERRLREKFESECKQREGYCRSLRKEMDDVKEKNSSLQVKMNDLQEAAVERQILVDMTAALLGDHLESCAHLDDTDTDEVSRGPFPVGQ